jgi:hypothetical protein
VPCKRQPASAKGVGDQTVRAGIDIRLLDFQHAIGVIDIPDLTALSLQKAGELELRSHRAVA